MELKTLRYFLEVARLGNFTAAASALNLTQPTLSKQIQELEAELGETLLIRGKRKTVLTEAGKYFFKNAEDIIALADKAKRNITNCSAAITGDVYIAGGETKSMSFVAKAIKNARIAHPGIIFHLFSGNAEAVSDRLKKGLADFGAFVLPVKLDNFDYIKLPGKERWGLLMRRDHPLAGKKHIQFEDLPGYPLISSAQHNVMDLIEDWMQYKALDIVATYTLLYNAALLVQKGVGAAVCLDGIADVSESSNLVFREFFPVLEVQMVIAWRKNNLFSRAAAVFQELLCKEVMQDRN